MVLAAFGQNNATLAKGSFSTNKLLRAATSLEIGIGDKREMFDIAGLDAALDALKACVARIAPSAAGRRPPSPRTKDSPDAVVAARVTSADADRLGLARLSSPREPIGNFRPLQTFLIR